MVNHSGLLPHAPASQYNTWCDLDSGPSSPDMLIRGDQDGNDIREWVPGRRRKRTGQSHESPVSETCPVRSDSEEVERFLDYFKEYSINAITAKEDAKWSHHRFVLDFVGGCVEHFPLRLAVLAWAAKQCPQEPPNIGFSAESWYYRAQEATDELMALQDPTTEITRQKALSSAADILLSTSVYLTRFDILEGNLDLVTARFRRMTEWLTRNPETLMLSAFACKSLLWLCYLQLRIHIFFTLAPHASSLLDELVRRVDYQDIFERSHTSHSEIFGNSYPETELVLDTEKIPVAARNHEIFCLLNSIMKYRSWHHYQIGTDISTTTGPAIEAEFRRMEIDFEMSFLTDPSASVLQHTPADSRLPHLAYDDTVFADSMTLSLQRRETNSQISFSWMNVYSLFLSAKIFWPGLFAPNIRTDDSSSAAVSAIFQIAMRLSKLQGSQQSGRLLSSTLWPLSLFMAGIETTDEVYADWMRLLIEQVASQPREQSAGSRTEPGRSTIECPPSSEHKPDPRVKHGARTIAELMRKVRERQNMLGRRVDVMSVAQDMDGAMAALLF